MLTPRPDDGRMQFVRPDHDQTAVPASTAAQDLRARWTSGFDEMRPHLTGLRDRDTQLRIERLALRFVDGRADLFARHVPGSTPASPLAHHCAAFRAHQRALDELLRSARTGVVSTEFADHQAMCRRHLEAGRVRLVLVGGPAHSDSSAIAEALGARHGAVVLAPTTFGSGAEHRSDRTDDDSFESMWRQAEESLRLGEQVVLDAPWSDDAARERARALALETLSDLIEIRCTAIGEPRTTPEGFDDWPEATVVTADGGFANALDRASVTCGWSMR